MTPRVSQAHQDTAFKDSPKLSTKYYVKGPRTMSGPLGYSNHLPPWIDVTVNHCIQERPTVQVHPQESETVLESIHYKAKLVVLKIQLI